jgi:2-polyprenyl-6-methoxyphenol hydroxylase-like FAD-dependent oxidoreductase
MQVCNHIADPSSQLVLVGDAAHNVTPQMGQGCNSALEDAVLLKAALTGAGWVIPAALQRYDATRRPQVGKGSWGLATASSHGHVTYVMFTQSGRSPIL